LDLRNNNRKSLVEYKNEYMNKKLADIALNEREIVEFITYRNEFIRLRDPIFTLPNSKFGRAHFFAPYKNIAGFYIDTFWFNIIKIWLSTGLWFIILYYDLLRKLIKYFENIKLQRFNKRILQVLKQPEGRS
jgi:hypothetical protein